MCKALEDMCSEAALQAAILANIRMGRDFGHEEEQIKEYIMREYNISAENAQEFLDVPPAA